MCSNNFLKKNCTCELNFKHNQSAWDFTVSGSNFFVKEIALQEKILIKRLKCSRLVDFYYKSFRYAYSDYIYTRLSL